MFRDGGRIFHKTHVFETGALPISDSTSSRALPIPSERIFHRQARPLHKLLHDETRAPLAPLFVSLQWSAGPKARALYSKSRLPERRARPGRLPPRVEDRAW